MENLSITIGIVGSLASLISLLFAAPGWRSKAMHVLYALVITAIATLAFEFRNQQQHATAELEKIANIERQANRLVQSADLSTTGSASGFIQASLTFLEKNKGVFPETYVRAKEICQHANCTGSSFGEGMSRSKHEAAIREAATSMEYLMRGIFPVSR